MPDRRRIALLAICALLIGAVGLTSVPAVLAGSDAICSTKPDQCGALTIRLGGYVAGDGAADNLAASPVLTCHHDPSATTNSCSGNFSAATGSRQVQVRAAPSSPAGITTCIAQVCGQNGDSQVVLNFTVTPGSRTTASVTFTKTGGHTITVTKGGTGTGTITSDKGSISCGSTCTWGYFDSELVVLTATPTGGSTFAGWTDAGTCTGQDATCHLVTSADKTTQALFDAPATPPSSVGASPTPTPTPKPTPTPTPTPTPRPSTGATPAPSAGHSTGPTFKPPTTAPGTQAPGGPTPDPNATVDPNAPTTDPNVPTTDPNAAPTPTPFKFLTDDPNGVLGAGGQPTTQPGAGNPASSSGSGPPIVLLGLVAVLGIVVFGGVFWWARRRTPGA
ncbi:MAG TPA: hypothetical protein VJ850_12070 [Candidatus Limnocylindrales bacterium]|nr:hypothetical protein [Candidatus Limnocylindrales bacterium]